MNLPAELESLLRDEAYADLCQESLTEALARISQQKEAILSTRPPFGVLATSETRQAFKTSLRSTLDNEAGLRTRLEQIAQIDPWLKTEIERALRDFLPTVSAEYRTCLDAGNVVTRWERAVETLNEISLGLARDAHAFIAAHHPLPLPHAAPPSRAAIDQACMHALASLRLIVTTLQSTLAEIGEIRARFTALCDESADGLQLPPPPDFRSLAWVDQLATLSAGHATAEASQCEAEARAFCATGLKRLLAQAAEVREACFEAGQAILAQYWRQLRTHAQAHFVRERDVDEVIAELAKRRLAAEVSRRQASFEAANFGASR